MHLKEQPYLSIILKTSFLWSSFFECQIILIQIQMDYTSNQRSVSPRQYRKADNISQVSSYSNNAIQLKPIDLLCNMHTEQPCNNYCVEGKCFQPLCSECIEGHLLHHKKNGYSDLSVKSLRTVRKDCAGKLVVLIEELTRRLEQLQAPPSPEKVMEQLEGRLEQAQKEAHEIVELEFTRLRDSLRGKISESATILRGMSEIHGKLEGIIQQLKENCAVLVEGRRATLSVPECIRNTITLNEQGLLDSFDKESVSYQARRRKIEFQVTFNPQIFKAGLTDALRVASPKSLNVSEASFSRPKYRGNVTEESNEWENSMVSSLPIEADPQEANRLLHFFETGSSRLHLVQVEGRKKGESRVVSISQFIVPSFHASLVSSNGDFIYLSGGLVELNSRSKSPLFMRYNIRSQVTKKDFAKVIPRSSHSLCQDKTGDIFILGGYGQSLHEEEPVYLNVVQRVSQRTGKVQVQAESRWGGSNISFRCKELIVKACEQGIELYNPRLKQWITADIRSKNQNDFTYFKNAGYASLSDSDLIIFGGYCQNLEPTDCCFHWKVVSESGRVTVHIKELTCRLPVPQGFENGKAVVDERGCWVLQNIEDDPDSCVDSERRLLRFQLKEGEGEWRNVQTISS